MDKYKLEEKISKASKETLENGSKVGKLAKGIFGVFEDIEYNEDLNIMIEKTKQAMQKKPNIITEASFNYENNFCSVDILKNDTDGVEIYEVKSSTEIHDIYIDDVAYQYYVLTNLGIKVKKANVVYINNQYIKHGEIELEKLFKIEEITETVKSMQEEIKETIKSINKFIEEHGENNEPQKSLGMECMEPYPCEYWEYCTKHLPKPNIFDIPGMRKDKKFEKYKEGLISFKDLQNQDLNEKYLEQIDFELNNREPKIEIEPIKELINSLKYPLYFIDFETFQLAIPEYEGTSPYQQLPFQYSLHIIREEGAELEHREFLAEIDDNDFIKHFAESMIKDIPDNGSILIYNNSFEPARLNEIAKMYPDLEAELTRLKNNMVDLLPPFRKRNYYVKEMQGSYSIKYVLPALYPNDPELDYHNLQIVHNGIEASETYLSLRGKTKEEQQILREALLTYCKLDTYAMVKVWEKLKAIIEGIFEE